MKQITQNELIELIKEKQKNAENNIEAIRREERRTIEDGQDEATALRLERNIAYYNAYQDLICYLQSVEMVPEKIKYRCTAPIGNRCVYDRNGLSDCSNCCFSVRIREKE